MKEGHTDLIYCSINFIFFQVLSCYATRFVNFPMCFLAISVRLGCQVRVRVGVSQGWVVRFGYVMV